MVMLSAEASVTSRAFKLSSDKRKRESLKNNDRIIYCIYHYKRPRMKGNSFINGRKNLK